VISAHSAASPGLEPGPERRAHIAAVSEKLRSLAAGWLSAGDAFAEPARLVLSERADPYTGAATLVGKWFPDDRGRRGELTINDDGSFFAEYDVLVWHGERFVEAVTAWGRGAVVRGEARMLDATGEQLP
jgi:hypothetical protein